MARHEKGKPVKASFFLARLQDDIKSLNSSVLIITEKMKYLVRNEKVLGRNLIVLHKKLKSLEEKIATGQFGPVPGPGGQQLQGVTDKLDELQKSVSELRAELQDLRENSATKEELQEMHYVVDSINPLQFITLEQAKDLLRGKEVKKKK